MGCKKCGDCCRGFEFLFATLNGDTLAIVSDPKDDSFLQIVYQRNKFDVLVEALKASKKDIAQGYWNLVLQFDCPFIDDETNLCKVYEKRFKQCREHECKKCAE